MTRERMRLWALGGGIVLGLLLLLLRGCAV
jgi:hypothetical protein